MTDLLDFLVFVWPFAVLMLGVGIFFGFIYGLQIVLDEVEIESDDQNTNLPKEP
jgi:hypothetical protein